MNQVGESGQLTSIADLVYANAPDAFFTPLAVGQPTIGAVEPIGALVAGEHPQNRVAEPVTMKARPCVRDQASTHSASPCSRIDVKCPHLTGIHIRVIRAGSGGDEPANLAVLDGKRRHWMFRSDQIKCVFARAVCCSQAVEILIFE